MDLQLVENPITVQFILVPLLFTAMVNTKRFLSLLQVILRRFQAYSLLTSPWTSFSYLYFCFDEGSTL